MTTAEQAAIGLCDEAIAALRTLDAGRLESLHQQAAAVALELRALALLEHRRDLPEVAARYRLLGSVVRATGENLRVLQRASAQGAGLSSTGFDGAPPWDR